MFYFNNNSANLLSSIIIKNYIYIVEIWGILLFALLIKASNKVIGIW